ncbi:unnamed protein product, partial [Anisakis simplex]|uniref:Hormone receptor 4 n=1 Tax=Anisakis simplex TaxID=6269 RepID=A0A0M3J4D8_ANISI
MRDVPAGSELTEQEEEMDRQLQRALQMSLEQNLPDPCTVAGGSGLSGNTTKQLISRFEKSGEVEQCSDPKVSLSVKESSCEATSSSCFSGTKIVGGCIKNPKGLVDADESMDVKDEVGPDGAPKPTDSEESAFRSADSSEEYSVICQSAGGRIMATLSELITASDDTPPSSQLGQAAIPHHHTGVSMQQPGGMLSASQQQQQQQQQQSSSSNLMRMQPDETATGSPNVDRMPQLKQLMLSADEDITRPSQTFPAPI